MFTADISSRIKKPIPALAIALAVFALIAPATLLAISSAQAAPADTASSIPQFGVVDLGKVANSSKVRRDAGIELRRMQQSNEAAAKRIIQSGAYLLSVPELNEIVDLYGKAQPTVAEQRRIDALEAKGNNLRRELTTLQNTPNPTAAQSERLTALGNLQTQADVNFKAVQKAMQQRLADQAQDAERRTTMQVRAAVAKIAKAKKLSVVFTGNVAYYVTVDITDDVIKDVSK